MKVRRAASAMRVCLAAVAGAALSLASASVFAAAAAGKQIDLAAVGTKADAEAALGQPVKEPQPRNGDGGDGYYSRCNYYTETGGKCLVLRFHQAAGKIEAKKQFEMLSKSTGKIEPVSGLGDRAGYSAPSAGSGAAAGQMMLYVVKGNAFLTIGFDGMDDEAAALNKAKELARKILASL